jgi:hypothetical protein
MAGALSNVYSIKEFASILEYWNLKKNAGYVRLDL